MKQENSTELDDSSDNSDSSINKNLPKNRKNVPITYDLLRQLSRKFHKYAPSNPFYRERIPYKTIIIVRVCYNYLGNPFLHSRNNIFGIRFLKDNGGRIL